VPPKIAIAFIGTGRYAEFFPRWKEAVDTYFLNDCHKTIFAFSDQVDKSYFNVSDVRLVSTPPVIWPEATLYRYKFLDIVMNDLHSGFLEEFDYVFYIDSDLYAVDDIKLDDMIKAGKNLVGVHHPGNKRDPNWHTLERRKESLACVDQPLQAFGPSAVYHQGCLWGGSSKAIGKMVKVLNERIDDDYKRKVVAVWYDESHMNRYFLENLEDVNTLSFLYAFPEDTGWSEMYPDAKIKMLHATKCDIEYPRPPSHTLPGSR
tara:strand:+ start:3822 stop:4604 length:783 start_codon:yes stop_codon:yes gene_type:complete